MADPYRPDDSDPLENLWRQPAVPEPVPRNDWRRRLVTQAAPGVAAGYRLADIGWRFASGLIDFAVAFVLPSLIFTGSWKLYGWWLMIGFAIQLLNGGVMAAWTGQSIGKKLTKQYLVQVRTRDVGSPTIAFLPLQAAILRVALHWVDAYTFIGFLLPYWSARRATLADRMVHSYVVRDSSVAIVPIRPADGQLVW